MNIVYELLMKEKERIESEFQFEKNQFDLEFRKNFDQELCDRRGYIDISETFLSKKDIIAKCVNGINAAEAKKYVLDSIIKEYGNFESLECAQYQNVTIMCDRIYRNENEEYLNGFLMIGGYAIPSPIIMSFDEYSKIYCGALKYIISNLCNEKGINSIDSLTEACVRILIEEAEEKELYNKR